MNKILVRWMILAGISAVIATTRLTAAVPSPLDDQQLSEVYAAGFDIKIDFDVNLAAQDPNSVVIDTGDLSALQDLAKQSMNHTSTTGSTKGGLLDGTGSFMPNFQNIANNIVNETTNNTLNMSDNAMQNARSLLNIIALNGDVAVGMNLVVVLNPNNTNVNLTQTNINWSNLNVSDLTSTLRIPAGQ